MARDLQTVMNDSVFTAINGYDASTDKLMFNNYGDKDTMTRTTNNFMHALQGSTGIPALNNKTLAGYVDGAIYGGALLTPRHAIFTRHAFLQPNSVLYFWDRNNVRYTRTVTHTASPNAGYSQAYGDYYIVLLDSDLPSSIEPLKVFPKDLHRYFKRDGFINATKWQSYPNDLLTLCTDQEEKSLIQRVTSIDFATLDFDEFPDTFDSAGNSRVTYGTPYDTDAQAWREALVPGDSGSPHMALIDDELILLGVTSTTSDYDGLTNARAINDFNKLIANADSAAGINTGLYPY